MTTIETSSFRASASPTVQLDRLGPISDLTGTWVGKGFNLVSVPTKDGSGPLPFRLLVNSTEETLVVAPIGGPIPNRGSKDDDTFFLGLHYLQRVSDGETNAGLHVETGLWLNLPEANGQPVLSRLASVPHGDSVMSLGTAETTTTEVPSIPAVVSAPFTIDSKGIRVNDTNPDYNAPFSQAKAKPPAGIRPEAVDNPNVILNDVLLSDASAGRTFVKTVKLSVRAPAIVDAGGAPTTVPVILVPGQPPLQSGGVQNIPFVDRNAPVTELSATFWIQTVLNKDGTQFLRLQYSQTVFLQFAGLTWPHISVATLVKQ
jgi:hypothetical protein